jgi:hypothetical protein
MRYSIPLAAAALFLAMGVSAFLPGARLWGINHLAFYDPVLRMLAMAVVAVTLIPAISRRAYQGLAAAVAFLAGRPAITFVCIGVTAAAALVCCYAFHSSTLLLGDGQLVLTTLQTRLNETTPLASTVTDIIKVDHISPGTTILYLLVAKVAGVAPIEAVRIVNSVLGALLLAAALLLVVRGSIAAGVRLWLLVLVVTTGVAQLFFGYVENYAVLVFFAMLYVTAAIAHLRGTVRLWLPVVFFAAALLSHVEGILLGPSLVYLLLWPYLRQRSVLRWTVPITALITLAATVVIATMTTLGRLVLTATGSDAAAGLLSLEHGIDVINEVMLLAPAAPIAAAFALSIPRGPTEHKPDTRVGWTTAAGVPYFIATVAIPCALYLAVFNAELGISRDWDLFAISVVWIIPASLLAGERWHSKKQDGFHAGVIPAFAIGAIVTVAWIGINAASGRTTERLQRTLAYDSAMSPYIYENLSIHYENEGDLPHAIAALEKAYDSTRNHRRALNLSLLYKQAGEPERANQLLRQTLRSRPKFERARRILALSLGEEQLFEELADVARAGTTHHPDSYFYHYYLGRAFVALGQRDEAVAALRTARGLEPPSPVRDEINTLLRSLGR